MPGRYRKGERGGFAVGPRLNPNHQDRHRQGPLPQALAEETMVHQPGDGRPGVASGRHSWLARRTLWPAKAGS